MAWFSLRRPFHVFLSYTSREDEVQVIQPLVDEYCANLWREARLHHLNIFYDHFSLERKWYADDELEMLLSKHLSKAHMFVGFVSPAYVESRWCCFEWRQGPMRWSVPEQVVYWKADYHHVAAYDRTVVQDLDRRGRTDVRFDHTDPAAIRDAARSAAREGLRVLLHTSGR